MEWIADPTAWLGLATLIVLEIVLGIDNLVFIAILADKLPPHLRDRARVLGLSLALLMRLGLLASISWMVTLTEPLFEVFGKSFSGRDLIMLFGGVFLLFKATMELHERLEGPCRPARRQQDLRAVLADRRADRGARRGVLARRGDHRGGHGRAPGSDDDRGDRLHRPDDRRQQAADPLRQSVTRR
ncbi:membrane protein, TerC family [Pseudomonas aeruginosa]|nr:membrane protein, TerC family [Pseudomonas aeruginosa]